MANFLSVMIMVLGFQCCQSRNPVPPNPPETFMSNVTISYAQGFIKGGLNRDYASKRGIEFSTTGGDVRGYGADLQRYDLGMDYTVFGVGPYKVCSGNNVTGSAFPPLWSWVSKASYLGSGEFELGSRGVSVDTWGFSASGVGMFEIAVMSSDPTRVVYLDLVMPGGTGPLLYVFIDWNTEAPPPEEMFNVPTICSKTQTGEHTTSPHTMFPGRSIAKIMALFN